MTNPIRTIGRYRLQRELGSGAMGTVHLALDPLLMRQVAIKVVRDFQGNNSEVLARFQREALISAKLNHPHIITIFDVGEDPVLGPFMAMEYIDGATLAKLIRERLAPREGLGLLIQVMSALLASELAGVSHRDVKPDNILVTNDWRVKLLDFGIARGDEARITQTGMIYGTPHYTAPEVLLGTEASCESDRYSFAVTAFELLSGALPFHGTSVGSILCSILQDPPTIPEAFSQEMKRVFQRALAKDPVHRYPDLLLFMEALLDAVKLTREEKYILRSQLAELRASALQAPMHTGPSPRETFDHHHRTLALPKVGTATRRSEHGPKAAGSLRKQRASAVTGAAAAGGHTTALLRGATLIAVALASVVLLALPARTRVGEWFSKRQRVHITSSPGNASPLKTGACLVPVNSDPPGARVFLNGQPMGSTPLTALRVPSEGRQELVLRHAGYREWRAVVDPELPLPDPIRLNPGQ